MAGAALHKEINATRSRIILPGRKNSLFTVIFLSQIKLSMISLPCLADSSIFLKFIHADSLSWCISDIYHVFTGHLYDFA